MPPTRILTHRKVSQIAAGSNPLKIGGPDYNDGHQFFLGAQGNLLYQDLTQADGANWLSGSLMRDKGPLFKSAVGSSLILQSGDPAESNSQSPLVIAPGHDGTICTTFIDAFGSFNTVAGIRCLGQFANLGSIATDGTFTPVSTAGSGVSCMIDCISDTTVNVVTKSSGSAGSHLFQGLDATGKFTFSIDNDGTLRWGTGGTYAAEDTSLGRAAAGTLALSGATPMLALGGSGAGNVGIKGSGTTLMIRLGNDGGYGLLDVQTIQPTQDFRINQNSVDVLTSVNAGAVINTLYLHSGKVGIGIDPVSLFDISTAGGGRFIVGNNSFGGDWMVFTGDSALSASKYFLATSQVLANGTNLNAPTGSILFFRVGNVEYWRMTASGTLKPANNATIAPRVFAGTPTDGNFTTPEDGMIAIDTTGSKLWARIGGTWKSVTLA